MPLPAEQVAPAAWRGREVGEDEMSNERMMKREKMMGRVCVIEIVVRVPVRGTRPGVIRGRGGGGSNLVQKKNPSF